MPEYSIEELRADKQSLLQLGQTYQALHESNPIRFSQDNLMPILEKIKTLDATIDQRMGQAYLGKFNLISQPTIDTEVKKPELPATTAVAESTKQDKPSDDSIGAPWKVGYSNMVNAYADAAVLTDWALSLPEGLAGAPMGGVMWKVNTPDELEKWREQKQELLENPIAGQFLSDMIKKANVEIKPEDLPTGKYAKSAEGMGWIDPARIYMTAAQNLPLLGSFVVTNAMSGGFSTMMMGAIEAGDANKAMKQFEEMTGKKIDPNTKEMIISSVGIINGALEKAGLNAILGRIPGAKGMVGRLVLGGITEAGTEGAQDLIKQYLAEQGYGAIPEDKLKIFLDSAYAGLILGFLGGGSSKIAEQMTKHNEREGLDALQQEQVEEKPAEQAEVKPETKAETEEEITEESSDEIQEAKQRTQESNIKAEERIGKLFKEKRIQETAEEKERLESEPEPQKPIPDLAEMSGDQDAIRWGEENKGNEDVANQIKAKLRDLSGEYGKLKSDDFTKRQKLGSLMGRYNQALSAVEGTKTAKALGEMDRAEKKEEVEPIQEQPKTTALKKEEIEQIRADYNLEELEPGKKEGWESLLNEAKTEKLDEQALDTAKEVIKKPRVIKNKEHASFVLKTAQLQNQYEENLNKAEEALKAGNEEESARYQGLAQENINDIDILTQAGDFSGREAGRALNIRKFRLNRENYTLTKLTQRARLAKNADLSAEESKQVKEYADQIKEQQKRIDELENEIEKLETEQAEKEAQDIIDKQQRKTRRKRTKARLQAERKDLKGQLAELGYRVNDVSGLTFEAAQIISKIAGTYVEEGFTNIKDVVNAVKKDVPEVSDKDIYDSFGGRVKRAKTVIVDEIKQNVKELKKQARLLGQIEDAANGVFDEKNKKYADSEVVDKLKKMLNHLRSQAYKTADEDAKLNKILLKLNDVQDQIDKGYREIRKTKKVDREDIKQAKQDLSELRRLMNTQDKITELEDQLKTGKFIVPDKHRRTIKNADLQDAQIKLKQLRREVNNHIENMRKRTAYEKFIDIITLPRALMATADMSYALRQGVWLSARRPVKAAKAFGKAFQSFFSEEKADAIDLAIREHPNQVIRDRAGLELTSLENIKFTEREEIFTSNLAEKVPWFGKVVKASNRNMVTGLNLLRTSAFDQFLEANPNATDEQLKAWADYINVASGRGKMGFVTSAKGMNIILFAQKFTASRITTPFKILQYWKQPTVRKEIAKDMASFVGLGGTALALASLAGFGVGLDPEDSDFGKIIIGDTRIDLWGGFIQPARLMTQIALKAADRAGVYEMSKDFDVYSSIGRFAMYKFAPSVAIPVELVTGKTVIGEEVTPVETLGRSLVPLVAQDVYEVYKNSGDLSKAAGVAGLAWMGVNIAEHANKPKRFEELEELALEDAKTNKYIDEKDVKSFIKENKYHLVKITKGKNVNKADYLRNLKGKYDGDFDKFIEDATAYGFISADVLYLYGLNKQELKEELEFRENTK